MTLEGIVIKSRDDYDKLLNLRDMLLRRLLGVGGRVNGLLR